MKRYYALSTALLIIGSAPLLARADDHEAIQAQMEDKRNQHVIDVMTTQMNLTTSQQTAVRTTLDNNMKALKDLQKEFAERQKELIAKNDAEITANLTDEQKAKYPDVKKQLQDEEAQARALRQKLNGGGNSSGSGGDSMGGHHGGGRHGGF